MEISEEGGLIYCDGRNMHAGEVHFDYPSVGATENVMMAAVLLPGTTVIHNPAREPEIADLQAFINAMGGKIQGAGTHYIEVEGVECLHGTEWTPMADRIVAGTLLAAAAITGGEITLTNAPESDMVAVTAKLREMGCEIDEEESAARLRAPQRLTAFQQLQTQPHPGFPTDMQPQLTTALCLAEGTSIITEGVWDNRFRYTEEFRRMGAKIQVDGKKIKSVSDPDALPETDEEKAQQEKQAEESKAVLDFVKETLGDKIKEARISKILKSAPVCMTADGPMSLEMEKYFSRMEGAQAGMMKAERVLELNPNSDAFAALRAAVDSGDKEKAATYVQVLYHQALLIAGLPIEDAAAYTQLVCSLMK